MTALWAHLEPPPPPAVKAPPCPKCRGGWYPVEPVDGLGLQLHRTCECPLGRAELAARVAANYGPWFGRLS